MRKCLLERAKGNPKKTDSHVAMLYLCVVVFKAFFMESTIRYFLTNSIIGESKYAKYYSKTIQQ